MQAAVVTEFGKSPRYQSFADPVAQQGEVPIRVRAAGLHPVVKAMAAGSHYASGSELPFIPGVDGVGELEDGRRVYFGLVRKPWGTMAERAAAPLANCIPVPEKLSAEEAAAIANPGMSGWMALKERAQFQPGETVLIMGATGVAGQLAIQVARALGAKRIVAAGRDVDALAGADVDAVIALTEPEDAIREKLAAEAAAGIDVVLDYLWGRPAELVVEALASRFKAEATHRTRLVEVGSSAGSTITLSGATLRSVDLLMMGSGFGAAPLGKILASIPELFRMAADGKLKIETETAPLSQVEQAWGGPAKGKRLVFVTGE